MQLGMQKKGGRGEIKENTWFTKDGLQTEGNTKF